MPFGFGKENKKFSNYAPKYKHGPAPVDGGQAQAHFPDEWSEFRSGLQDGMSGEFPKIDNGGGSKDTLYKDDNLRYDREKPCYSYGHPQDRFHNYSVQANSNAQNLYLILPYPSRSYPHNPVVFKNTVSSH